MMPKPMDGYVRVSRRLGREGAGYISPSVQREAIERWADYKGVTVARWFIDEDESGGTHDRPGLNEAVTRAVEGVTGGIVSWKIDRFSRFTEGGLRDLRRLEDAGARLVFVTEDIDTSGPMGKFVYTVMLAMSEYFLDMIKAGWVTAKTKAIDRGAHIGPAPFGYRRADDGTLEVDPVRGPVVARAFEIAAEHGLHAAVPFLIEHAPERTWTAYTTERFLGNRTYLGQVTSGQLARRDAHTPLVGRQVFEAANNLEPSRLKRRPSGRFPLSGVALCAGCGGPLVGARGGNDKRRMYRCAARCEASAVMTADLLEGYVVATLREALEGVEWEIGEPGPEVDDAAARVVEAERDLDEFLADTAARRILGDRYHAALQKYVGSVEAAQEAMRQVTARAGMRRRVPGSDLPDAEYLEQLRGSTITVSVRRGRGPVSDRVRIGVDGVDDSDGGAVLP